MSLKVAEQYKSEIMDVLKLYDKDLLLDILADARFEWLMHENGLSSRDADRDADGYRCRIYSDSVSKLHNYIFASILKTNKSDTINDGFWVDRKGYHKIYIKHSKTKTKQDEPQKDSNPT